MTQIAVFMVVAPHTGVACVRRTDARIPADWDEARVIREAPQRLPATMHIYAPDAAEWLIQLYPEDQDPVEFDWTGPGRGQVNLFG